jgi:hypothetical protein
LNTTQFTTQPKSSSYEQRLNIFWNMNETLPNGFPDEAELSRLHDFENRLIDAVETDEFSIMSMVLTGNGEREFVFHTPDPQEFVTRLSGMPQEGEPYPIEINCNEDPEWEYYYNELSAIKSA